MHGFHYPGMVVTAVRYRDTGAEIEIGPTRRVCQLRAARFDDFYVVIEADDGRNCT